MTEYIRLFSATGRETINEYTNKISISRYIKIPCSAFIENQKYTYNWSVYTTSRGYGHYNSVTRTVEPSIGAYSYDVEMLEGELMAGAICHFSDACDCVITKIDRVIHIDIGGIFKNDRTERPQGFVYIIILKESHSSDNFGIRCLNERGEVIFHSSDYYPNIIYSGLIEYLTVGRYTNYFTGIDYDTKGAGDTYSPFPYDFRSPTEFSYIYIKDLYTNKEHKITPDDYLPVENMSSDKIHLTLFAFPGVGTCSTWGWYWKGSGWRADKQISPIPTNHIYLPLHSKKPKIKTTSIANGFVGRSTEAYGTPSSDNYTADVVLKNYLPCKNLFYHILDVTNYVNNNQPLIFREKERAISPIMKK